MSLVARILSRGDINFPVDNCKFIIEDNPGDEWPIHIHLGQGSAGKDWKVRIHFTYKEFDELIKNMIEEKKEYGTRY